MVLNFEIADSADIIYTTKLKNQIGKLTADRKFTKKFEFISFKIKGLQGLFLYIMLIQNNSFHSTYYKAIFLFHYMYLYIITKKNTRYN